MGDPNASDEKLWEVLKQVKLADFLKRNASSAQAGPASKRPSKTENTADGLDTLLTEQGGNLSGGQRQRLALARAFLHDAPFLLLDEPTSNLDSLNEAVILRSLKEEQEDKTIVLVSHRQSTMRIADRTYSVEHGRVS